MKWKLDLPKPLMLVYYFGKLTGLAQFTLKKKKVCPPKLLDTIYPIFIAVAYSLFIALSSISEIKHYRENTKSKWMTLWLYIQYVSNYPIVVFTLLAFVLMKNKISQILETLCAIDIELRNFGIVENHEKFFKKLLATTTMANVAIIGMCVLFGFMEPYWPLFSSIKYAGENWFTVNIIFAFFQLLICIRKRFALLNQILLDMFKPNRRLGGRNSESEILRDIQRLQKIEGLHLDLCGLVDQTTSLFTTPIIFMTFQFLITLTTHCYFLYFITQGQVDSGNTSFLGIIFYVIHMFPCAIPRIIIMLVEIFTIAHASATTYEEKNSLKVTLAEIWDNATPQDIQDEFFTFHLQLAHESAHVTILGFFRLDYLYIYKISCAVMAYLVVMIQFGTSKSNFRS